MFVDARSEETLLHWQLLADLCALLLPEDETVDTLPDWVGADADEHHERETLRLVREEVVVEIVEADDEELVTLARRWADTAWFPAFFYYASTEVCAAAAYALLRHMQELFSHVDLELQSVYAMTNGYVHPG